MSKKYVLRYSGHSIEMSKPNNTILIYKFPYADVKDKCVGFQIPNQFIVYILWGRNETGKDMIYVGKSKNGINNRPVSHENKYDRWTTCYVLTQFKERTFFNDGTIQYLENEIDARVREVNLYQDVTINTNTGTANKDDEEDCDAYLEEAYVMLEALGLDLITNSEEKLAEQDMESSESSQSEKALVPNGTYYFERKVKRLNTVLRGTMEVKNSKFILKAGSDISQVDGIGMTPHIEELRRKINIKDGVLQKDVELEAPSACGTLILGASCNGWVNWKTKDGRPIDIFRKTDKSC